MPTATPMLVSQPPAAGAADIAVRETTLATFVADVIEASREGLVLVEFGASWCGPCKQLTPVLEKIARGSQGAVRLAKVDIDRDQQIAQQMGVQSVPSVFAFIDGRPVDGFAGALPESQIKTWLDPLLKKAGGAAGEQAAMIESALAQAATFMDQKDYVTAHAVYLDVLDREPANPIAYAGMARCALASGDAVEARKLYEAAPPELAKHAAMQSLRAALELSEQAAAAGSTAELEAKLARDPGDHQARFDLALALYADGQREAAIDHLLDLVARARSWNEDAARKQLIQFFDAMGPADPLTVASRRRLSSVLFS